MIAKIREEIAEIEEELSEPVHDQDRLEDELGDILFTVANLARHLSVEPEKALRRTNAKVVRRFTHIETELRRSGRALSEASLDEMEALWVEAKATETKKDRP